MPETISNASRRVVRRPVPFIAGLMPIATHRPFLPGRDTAPSGAPVTLRGTGDEGSQAGIAFVIRCTAGGPLLPARFPEGKYLGWIGGHFIPCCRQECAKPYATHRIARAVATRAESAFPGARFDVVEIAGGAA